MHSRPLPIATSVKYLCLALSPGLTQLPMLHVKKQEGLVHVITWGRLVFFYRAYHVGQSRCVMHHTHRVNWHHWLAIALENKSLKWKVTTVIVQKLYRWLNNVLAVSSITRFGLSKALVLCYTRQGFSICVRATELPAAVSALFLVK